MKSSVCIFTQESSAKMILHRLRDNYLRASHSCLNTKQEIEGETELHAIEAEERFHHAFLDEIAEFERTGQSQRL